MQKKQFWTDTSERLVFGVIWVILTFFLYYYHLKINISSDNTTMLPVAKDLLCGNILLKGWTLGTNNFLFTETIFYAIFMLFGCSCQFMIHFIPAAVISTLAVFCLYFFIYKDNTLRTQASKNIFLMCAMTVVFLGIVGRGAAYTLINPNSHNNLYIFTAVCIVLVLNYMRTEQLKYLIIYDILAVLMSFSESVTSMVLFAPVGLFCVYKIIFVKVDRKKGVILLSNSIGAFIASKLLTVLVAFAGGVYTRGLPLGLAHPRYYPGRIFGFLKEMLLLFGFRKVDGIVVTPETLLNNVFVCIVVLGCTVILIYNLVRFFKLSDLDRLLFLLVIVNLGLSVITDVVVYHRYIAPAFIFGFILCARTLISCMERLSFYKKLYRFLAVITVFMLIVRVKDVILMPKFAAEEKVVMEEIVNRGWGDGYGDFWCASMPSFYSGFTTDIYPVYTNENGLFGYEELVKSSWFREKDKHFVITFSGNASGFINNERLFEILGEPDDGFEYGSYQVFYYERDISENVLWAGKD